MVVDMENGGCIWNAFASESTEMIPWVHGWAADCEAVEADWLRRQLA